MLFSCLYFLYCGLEFLVILYFISKACLWSFPTAGIVCPALMRCTWPLLSCPSLCIPVCFLLCPFVTDVSSFSRFPWDTSGLWMLLRPRRVCSPVGLIPGFDLLRLPQHTVSLCVFSLFNSNDLNQLLVVFAFALKTMFPSVSCTNCEHPVAVICHLKHLNFVPYVWAFLTILGKARWLTKVLV